MVQHQTKPRAVFIVFCRHRRQLHIADVEERRLTNPTVRVALRTGGHPLPLRRHRNLQASHVRFLSQFRQQPRCVASSYHALLSFLSGRQCFFCLCRAYSLGAHGAAVKRPVCDVRHTPLYKPVVHSAISAATESGVSTVRSTTIGMNLDSSPATNAFVRNVRYASVTAKGS